MICPRLNVLRLRHNSTPRRLDLRVSSMRRCSSRSVRLPHPSVPTLLLVKLQTLNLNLLLKRLSDLCHKELLHQPLLTTSLTMCSLKEILA